ncbi:MAG: ribose-phosphate pyrophosphokinase [Deltaproteobacteria bacterium]|nr:ribose-phosphate pyrophosphokinase [Deltaproteobacteria bacterium]
MMKIFSLDQSQDLSYALAERLGIELSPLEIRKFSDGEYKVRPLVSVSGDDVSVVATFIREGDLGVHDKLCLALFLGGALRDSHARSVHLVAPYLCYARKDQRTKSRDPLTLKYVASLIETAGYTSISALDVHNASAFESAFRVPVEHLSARELLAARLATLVGKEPLTLITPDFGGAKRVFSLQGQINKLRGSDDTKFGLVIKERSAGEVRGGPLLGDVDGRVAIIFDDLISSGATAQKAARTCLDLGARKVILAATHIVLGTETVSRLSDAAIDFIIGTNTTLALKELPDHLTGKCELLDVSRVFAKTTECSHRSTLQIDSPILA